MGARRSRIVILIVILLLIAAAGGAAWWWLASRDAARTDEVVAAWRSAITGVTFVGLDEHSKFPEREVDLPDFDSSLKEATFQTIEPDPNVYRDYHPFEWFVLTRADGSQQKLMEWPDGSWKCRFRFEGRWYEISIRGSTLGALKYAGADDDG